MGGKAEARCPAVVCGAGLLPEPNAGCEAGAGVAMRAGFGMDEADGGRVTTGGTGVAGGVGARVATELPADNTSWSASGFTTVGPAGGSPNIYVPLSRPVVSLDCWAAAPNGGRPPLNLAAQQCQEVHRAALEHGNVPRWVTMPAASRRIPGDVASYAHFQMDLELWWAE
jgi:hypothetical protein